MNAILAGLFILLCVAIAAVLLDPKAQRHLASWLRARADRQEDMRIVRRNALAFEELQRRAYLREMEGL